MEQDAIFFDYADINGQRYHASEVATAKASSLVEAYLTVTSTSTRSAEILEIFQFQQSLDTAAMWFARVRWFKEYGGDREMLWND